MKEMKSVERLQLERKNCKRWSLALWGVVLFVLLIVIDQVTKIAADAYFNMEGAPNEIAILPGWIYLRITYNTGIAYGKGGDASEWVKIAVVVATGVLMIVLAVMYFVVDPRRAFLRFALIFVVAGGVGNLIDRVYYRVWDPVVIDGVTMGVRDMVDLDRFGFAVCNFADFFITGGAATLVLALLFFDRDALLPMGKKYKALAQEADDKKNELVKMNNAHAVDEYETRTEEGESEG